VERFLDAYLMVEGLFHAEAPEDSASPWHDREAKLSSRRTRAFVLLPKRARSSN